MILVKQDPSSISIPTKSTTPSKDDLSMLLSELKTPHLPKRSSLPIFSTLFDKKQPSKSKTVSTNNPPHDPSPKEDSSIVHLPLSLSSEDEDELNHLWSDFQNSTKSESHSPSTTLSPSPASSKPVQHYSLITPILSHPSFDSFLPSKPTKQPPLQTVFLVCSFYLLLDHK